MNKLIAALIAAAFSFGAFAQTAAPAAAPAAPCTAARQWSRARNGWPPNGCGKESSS